MSTTNLRIDELDLQILKLLTHDCRASYRSLGRTLGISKNTVQKRVKDLILNKTIEQFITLVNFSLFGYSKVLTVVLKFGKNDRSVISLVMNNMKDLGPIYMHVEVFNNVHAIGIALKDTYINIINIVSIKKNLTKVLGNSSHVIDIFFGKIPSLVSEKFNLRKIDFKIIDCLISDPRMKFLDIARNLHCSQKTIIRRIEKMESSRIIMGYTLQYNPSYMKGYNYFSMLIQTRSGKAVELMKEILYSDLNEYILTFHPFNFEDRVIIVFHVENVADSESIVNNIRSMKGVLTADAYQPLRIKWYEEWLKKKIRNKILSD